MSSPLVAFEAITKFVSELNDAFGPRQKSLALYNRLLEKTTLKNRDAIDRQIGVFSNFLSINKESIESQTELKSPSIVYNDKVFINMKLIFEWADVDEAKAIWKHLLTIYAIVDPSGDARNILKNMKGKEKQVIGNMIEKITSSINPNETNPMAAMMGLVSSGVFTELVGTMQSGMADGTLDMGSMFQSISGMFGSMGAPGAPNPLAAMMNVQQPQGAPVALPAPQADVPPPEDKTVTG